MQIRHALTRKGRETLERLGKIDSSKLHVSLVHRKGPIEVFVCLFLFLFFLGVCVCFLKLVKDKGTLREKINKICMNRNFYFCQ